MIIDNGESRASRDELVLFPFDDHSLPLQTGLELQLVSHRTTCNTTQIVLAGEPGAPDSRAAVYYGTVLPVGDELRMWYLGQDHDEGWFERVCFATSRDGKTWEKPALDLVDLNAGSHHVQSCVVFHDPDEDERRFKMVYQTRHYQNRFAAYSADGLHWQDDPNNPVGAQLEMAGGTRIDGVYYLSGQGGNHPGPTRQMVNHLSYDFENWSEALCVGLKRGDTRHPDWATEAGKQVHLGASMWNRGNVVVGFYGMWNGHPGNDRRWTHMDLGLCVSQNGLQFRAPIPDFPIVSAAGDGWLELPHGAPALEKPPALIQGQGCVNLGDETLFWYAPWPEQVSDGVRVAVWQRDRLGYYQGYLGGRHTDGYVCHCVSAPIDLESGACRVSINADGLGEHGQIRVEVLDESLQPLAGYDRTQSVPLRDNGLARRRALEPA